MPGANDKDKNIDQEELTRKEKQEAEKQAKKEEKKRLKEESKKEHKGLFAKIKDIFKKGLNLIKSGLSSVGSAVAAVGVRVLGGKEAYNAMLDQGDEDIFKEGTQDAIGTKVVCKDGDYNFEGTVKAFTTTKDGREYTVELCNGKTIQVPEDQIKTVEVFKYIQSQLPKDFRETYIDAESFEKYSQEFFANKEPEGNEQPEEEPEENEQPNEEPEENEQSDEELFEESPEESQPDEQQNNQQEETTQDDDWEPVDLFGTGEQQPQQEEKTQDAWDFVDLFGTEEQSVEENEDEVVFETDEEIEPEEVFDEKESSESKEENEAQFDIPAKSEDLKEGDHVVYSYKANRYQEAEITAVNKKSIEIQTNDGKAYTIKNNNIAQSIFGYEDVKNDKVMAQCVTDEKNSKFSPEFRAGYYRVLSPQEFRLEKTPKIKEDATEKDIVSNAEPESVISAAFKYGTIESDIKISEADNDIPDFYRYSENQQPVRSEQSMHENHKFNAESVFSQSNQHTPEANKVFQSFNINNVGTVESIKDWETPEEKAAAAMDAVQNSDNLDDLDDDSPLDDSVEIQDINVLMASAQEEAAAYNSQDKDDKLSFDEANIDVI